MLGWWPVPAAFGAIDPAEVHRADAGAGVDHLLDPAIRFTTSHPTGYVGPAFELDDLLLWGFTAVLFSRVLELAGLERPWDADVRRPLPERFHPRGRVAQGPGRSSSEPEEGRR